LRLLVRDQGFEPWTP